MTSATENTDAGRTLPYDQFLTERLAALRQEHPEWPLTMHRMHLIKALHEEAFLSPKEARDNVDAYYSRNGLGIPQPSIAFSILFGVLASPVLVIPVVLVYLLWRYFHPQ
jgi:hypothetical protein